MTRASPTAPDWGAVGPPGPAVQVPFTERQRRIDYPQGYPLVAHSHLFLTCRVMGPVVGERAEERVRATDGSDVRQALRDARVLVGHPQSLDHAIGALEDLALSLEPFALADPRDRSEDTEPLRTVLSAHLLAVRALRDVEASDDSVSRLVRRAIDGAEHLMWRGAISGS